MTPRASTAVNAGSVLAALDEVEQLVLTAGDLTAALESAVAGDDEFGLMRGLRESLALVASLVAKVKESRTPATEDRG